MEPRRITVGEGARRRAIACLVREARGGRGPTALWLGGFRSDMRATKAEALDAWAAAQDRAFVRFDYSGHGASEGRFEDATISDWLADARTVADAFAGERPILVGSSMGGWIALLMARALAREGNPAGGLVLIAPAADFTERLMWARFPEEVRAAILERGVYHQPSAYAPEPTPITRALIEDGRGHLLLDAAIEVGCPVRILQGMRDPDVPWEHALATVERLPPEDVVLTLVKEGDHRLSREIDLARLTAAVAELAEGGSVRRTLPT